MNTRKFIQLFALMLFTYTMAAQTISLNLPKLTGESYACLLFQGEQRDTVARGVVPTNGHFDLSIPSSQKGYKGMMKWVLKNDTTVDLYLVVNNQDYTATCSEAIPNIHNIHFSGSDEMAFYADKQEKQQLLQTQLETHRKESAKKELNNLNRRYEMFGKELSKSNYYAARYLEIKGMIHTMEIASANNDLNIALKTNEFITQKLDWQALYTSGRWNELFADWINLNLNTIGDEELFLGSIRQVLNRLPTNELYTAFAEKLTKSLINGPAHVYLDKLASDVAKSGKLLNTYGYLYLYDGIFPGQQAPALKGFPDISFRDKTLLVFYGSRCGHCTATMNQLTRDYDQLAEAGIKIISVDSELDSITHNENSQKYPWPDKLLEPNGFGGENFRTYGVHRTPGIFLIDKNQQVIARYKSVETGEIIDQFN